MNEYEYLCCFSKHQNLDDTFLLFQFFSILFPPNLLVDLSVRFFFIIVIVIVIIIIIIIITESSS